MGDKSDRGFYTRHYGCVKPGNGAVTRTAYILNGGRREEATLTITPYLLDPRIDLEAAWRREIEKHDREYDMLEREQKLRQKHLPRR